jgi:hypothetical protein
VFHTESFLRQVGGLENWTTFYGFPIWPHATTIDSNPYQPLLNRGSVDNPKHRNSLNSLSKRGRHIHYLPRYIVHLLCLNTLFATQKLGAYSSFRFLCVSLILFMVCEETTPLFVHNYIWRLSKLYLTTIEANGRTVSRINILVHCTVLLVLEMM